MAASTERTTIKIHGRVQGVFFRANTEKKAHELNVVGYVRNTEDGGVEVVAEGAPESLTTFESWCRHGPPSANVTSCTIMRGRATGTFKRFEIVP